MDAPIEGVSTEDYRVCGIEIYSVEIRTEEAARRMGKPIGRYVTLSDERLSSADIAEKDGLADAIRQTVFEMLPPSGDVLVVGLGNRKITADALGSRVLENLLVTRHMKSVTRDALSGRLRGVCAVAPGVLGVTGLETAEVVKGILERARPAAVIAIDALAARETRRIGTTLQITDTGIRPGSGVGNHRMGLTRETLGVPVLALGVPMVVYASVIARDALSLLFQDLAIDESSHAEAVDALIRKVAREPLGDLVVTPREVDDMVGRVAFVIAEGLNRALQPKLSKEEITSYSHESL